MLNQIRPALVLLIALTAITGLAYPFAMTGLSGLLFPYQAQGSLIAREDGTIIGSALIGQPFQEDKYFHGRPSATTGPDPADATKSVSSPNNAVNSMGSNLGPTSKALAERMTADVDKLKAENPGTLVPVDLVTTSASGLDPDISPEAAQFQVARVAKARGVNEDRVRELIAQHIQSRTVGLLGEPKINVLALNMALDKLQQ
jgi:K+-transporting ATPase ATPase C chain